MLLAAVKSAGNNMATKVKEAKLAVTTAEATPFQLYGNLLSNKAGQP